MTPEEREARRVALLQAEIDAYEWLNARRDDDGSEPVGFRDAVLVVPAGWVEELIASGEVVVKRRLDVDDDQWFVVGSGYGVFLRELKARKGSEEGA